MASLSLTRLTNRKLIKIAGPDCYPYLQSLLSNDLRQLYEPHRTAPRLHANVSSSVLSSFMLNAQGRSICDILLYRTPRTRYECKFTPPGEASEYDELLIECDAGLANGLANTLYGYRVRRKVNLEILPDQQVWCLYPDLNDTNVSTLASDENAGQLIQLKTIKHKELLDDQMTVVSDPRLDLMGLRILVKDKCGADHIKSTLNGQISGHNIKEASVKKYIIHRYTLGVGEGPNDHPEANCLPLECNADLLGSVSFDKGCYLGQELTARIHFTGVVRKRLMPCLLNFDENNSPEIPILPNLDIIDKNGKKLGVLRHHLKNCALSLLRHDLITNQSNLCLSNGVKLTAWRPYWWRINPIATTM